MWLNLKTSPQRASCLQINYFFKEDTTHKVEEAGSKYGFATKSDIEEIISMINKLKQEIAALKTGTAPVTIRKKKK